jgi:2-keto-3-deoxy-L-rhamnonate aldolase RhmA
MQPNLVKPPILAGETVVGAMTFEFFSPGMSAILANAGCRFVIYDMEHTGLGFETLKWLFASCRGLPIEPMVRVPRGEYTWLARALDLGARPDDDTERTPRRSAARAPDGPGEVVLLVHHRDAW